MQRTGIEERRHLEPGQTTSDLAVAAAHDALARAGFTGADIDLIVLATTTPERTLPATATRVQAAIGMAGGAAFDVQAVCSGFVFATSVADAMIRTGQARTALVIGADAMSRLLDWSDRATCVVFADGAGAAILRARTYGEADEAAPGILSTHLHSDGALQDKIRSDGGPSWTGTIGCIRMEGREVFLHAVASLAAVAQEAAERNGIRVQDIDWFVPHQANRRIIEAVALKLGVPVERFVVTVTHHGNTSAASVPLALHEAVADGRIRRGDLVLLGAMGAGMTWGAVLARW